MFVILRQIFLDGGNDFLNASEVTASQLTLADADGTNEIVLPLVIGNMEWSPDSSQFVYQSRSAQGNTGIFLYTLKTGKNVKLTGRGFADADPSFSPDGDQIAFTSWRDGNAEIYTMETDGSNVRRLTTTRCRNESQIRAPTPGFVCCRASKAESMSVCARTVKIERERKVKVY